MHLGKTAMNEKTTDGNSKEIEALKTDNKRKQDESLGNIESKYKRNRDEILVTHGIEDKKVFTENKKSKKAFLPSCPVCFETIQPPLQIYYICNHFCF